MADEKMAVIVNKRWLKLSCFYRPAVSEWAGILDDGWDTIFLEMVNDLTTADSTVTVRCNLTGCDVMWFQSLTEFGDLLANFQTKPISESVPLKVTTCLFVSLSVGQFLF